MTNAWSSFAQESDYRRFEMPDANLDVALLRLHAHPTGPFLSAVRFPAGFRREPLGCYDVHELFFVLDGALNVSGRIHLAGELGWIPAGSPRFDTATDTGALTLACFSGLPVWQRIASPSTDGGFSAKWDRVCLNERALLRDDLSGQASTPAWVVDHRRRESIEVVAGMDDPRYRNGLLVIEPESMLAPVVSLRTAPADHA